MARRYIVLALAAVLALAVAVPVLAAPDRAVAPKVVAVSKQAIKKSRSALRVARQAKRQARSAAENAAAALAAASAQPATPRVQIGLAAAPATTESESFVALAGGPSVEVNVPASGLIEVWAQVTMDGAGTASLYQDGAEMPGQSEVCGAPEGGGGLFSGESTAAPGEPTTLGTPASLPFCGTEGAPGPVLFQTTPGTHRYELRYASCGCSEGGPGASPVTFSARRIYVAPRP